jgi:hypothetical protein
MHMQDVSASDQHTSVHNLYHCNKVRKTVLLHGVHNECVCILINDTSHRLSLQFLKSWASAHVLTQWHAVNT